MTVDCEIFSSSGGNFCRLTSAERSSWWVAWLKQGAEAPQPIWLVSENHICEGRKRKGENSSARWSRLLLAPFCFLLLLPIPLGAKGLSLALPRAETIHAKAYLPLVGPPPLRFEVAIRPVNDLSWMPKITTPAVETNPPQEISSVTSNNVTPMTLATQTVLPTNPPISLPPENLSTNSTPLTPPANDLLVVTPEMLVDYFKPNPTSGTATNSVNVHVLAPVNFTPPASATTPSSQAIYLSP